MIFTGLPFDAIHRLLLCLLPLLLPLHRMLGSHADFVKVSTASLTVFFFCTCLPVFDYHVPLLPDQHLASGSGKQLQQVTVVS